MKFDPDRHHRRSLRLRGYDYAQTGAYFVTVCAQTRACLFGEVVKGQMAPNDAGVMIWSWWDKLPGKFPTVAIDAFIVMPNHVHAIIVITHPVGATRVVALPLPRVVALPLPRVVALPLPRVVALPQGWGTHMGVPLRWGMVVMGLFWGRWWVGSKP